MEELDFEEGIQNKTTKTYRDAAQEVEDILSGKTIPKFHCVNYSSEEKREERRELKEEAKEAILERGKIDRAELNKFRPKDFQH